MDELAAIAGGANCATDQVLYNPEARGIEFSLLPWCAAHAMPVMAYSPLGQAGRLLRAPALAQVAARHRATPAQVALAWALRHPHVLAIPKASDAAHVRENAAAAALRLTTPTSPHSTRPSRPRDGASACRCFEGGAPS